MATLLRSKVHDAQRLPEAIAGALAKQTDIGIEIVAVAELLKEADGVPRRMRTAAFLMDQQLAENACPEVVCRHAYLRSDERQRQPEHDGGSGDGQIDA
jgi:hypothetical protein